jgi:hypothetical protein
MAAAGQQLQRKYSLRRWPGRQCQPCKEGEKDLLLRILDVPHKIPALLYLLRQENLDTRNRSVRSVVRQIQWSNFRPPPAAAGNSPRQHELGTGHRKSL